MFSLKLTCVRIHYQKPFYLSV